MYKHYQSVHKTKKPKKEAKKEEVNSTPIKCMKCDKIFSRSHIYIHMVKVHKEPYKQPPKKTKTKKKTCPKCKKKLTNIPYHLLKVHNIKQDPNNAGKKKGNLFFITVQHPIKHFMMRMFKRKRDVYVRHYRYAREHAHLLHIVRSTKQKIYRGQVVPHFPVYSGKYEFSTYYTASPIRDRKSRFKFPPRTVIKEGVAGNEWGVLEEHGHCHFYMKFHKKVFVSDLQKYIRKRCRFLGSIEPGRSADKQIKYCSKEDYKALVYNVDRERLHDRWQMGQIAFKADDFRDGVTKFCYQSTKWKVQYKYNQFKTIFDSIRSKIAFKEAAESSKKYANPAIMNQLSPSKKGIWISGKPGVGKTSTVFAYTKGEHFHMPKIINQFAFNTWEQQNRIIIFEDVERQEMIKHSRLINELTDDRGITIGERKGGDHFVVKSRKVIITTNDTPPTEEEWQGFSRRFDIIDCDNLDTTLYRYFSRV